MKPIDKIVDDILAARMRHDDLIAVRGRIRLGERYAVLRQQRRNMTARIDRLQAGPRRVYLKMM